MITYNQLYIGAGLLPVSIFEIQTKAGIF